MLSCHNKFLLNMAASTSSSCSVSGSVSDNTGFNSDLDSATEESELDQEK